MATETDIMALAGLVAALAATGYLFHRLRLPPAVGYLAIGILAAKLTVAIGFSPESEALVHKASGVGVLFLLFAIGLELDIKRLREVMARTALVLPIDILVPALVLAGAARVAGWDVLQAVGLGLCLCISSTLFGERLSASPAVPAEARRRVLGVLLSEDVAAGAVLALLVVLGTPQASDPLVPLADIGLLLLFLLMAAAAALLVVPRLLDLVARTHSHELLVLVGLAVVLGFGALGNVAGSAPLGALVAGVAAAEAGSRFVVRNALQTVREVALAVFFFASGLVVDPQRALGEPILVLVVAGLFLASKLMVHVPTALASGMGLEASLRGAIALGTIGEFSLILVAAAPAAAAHPLLADVVVGAMVVLLVVTPLLMLAVPRIARILHRLPIGLRRPLQWFVQGSRQARARPANKERLQSAIRLLVVNLLFVLALALATATLSPWLLGRMGTILHPAVAPTLVAGAALALSVPLFLGAYRAYRSLVVEAVGSVGNHHATQARVRLVDTWVATSIGLLLIPLGLLIPDILPILLGGVFLAVIIVALSWRRLNAFHHTMELSLSRVLGHDAERGAFLDRMLERYPWGLRTTAVSVPPTSPVAGHRIEDTRLHTLTGATVAVVQRRGHEIVNPAPAERILPGDTLVLLGDVHQLARAEAIVVAHGGALRMAPQSRLAAIGEVEVRPGSALVGATLSAADLRRRTGTLVVGVWRREAQHPTPYQGGIVLGVGDRLILLGVPLQMERARLLAEGVEVESEVDSRE